MDCEYATRNGTLLHHRERACFCPNSASYTISRIPASPADMDLLHDLCHSSSHIRLTMERSGDTKPFVRYSAAVAWSLVQSYDPLMDRDVAIRSSSKRPLTLPKPGRVSSAKQGPRQTLPREHHGHPRPREVEGRPTSSWNTSSGRSPGSHYRREGTPLAQGKTELCPAYRRGLQYAHANLIIHPTIKPENIKVLGNGRVSSHGISHRKTDFAWVKQRRSMPKKG